MHGPVSIELAHRRWTLVAHLHGDLEQHAKTPIDSLLTGLAVSRST